MHILNAKYLPLFSSRLYISRRTPTEQHVPQRSSVAIRLGPPLHREIEEVGRLFPPQSCFRSISSTSTVDGAIIICVLAPMLMGPPFRKKRKLDFIVLMYTKVVNVAIGSRSSLENSSGPRRGVPVVVLLLSRACGPPSGDGRSLYRAGVCGGAGQTQFMSSCRDSW